MKKLDRNLEAYRVLAESLHRLRQHLRAALQARHGDGWECADHSSPVWQHLRQRREREAAVSWRLPEGSDLLEYANFTDLLEAASSDESLLADLSALAPSVELVRARCLELDVVWSRVAYARPISESELEFVVSFGERLRKWLGEASPPATVRAEPAVEPRAEPAVEPRAEPAAPPPVATPPAPSAAEATAPPPRTPSPQSLPPPPSNGAVAAALAQGDASAVLTALYQEITRVADTLWRAGEAPEQPVWDAVRESRWFREHFSRLGLKVVSDFYALVARCREGASDVPAGAKHVHELLKDANFAHMLITLRDFFKGHLGREQGSS